MGSERARWWEGLSCGVVVVVCILCSFPYAEMGFIDDWSYVKTAFEYARTGHFVYNGWATAMLGWQVPWGALFVKGFGYTFWAVRASMLPVALAAVWLFFALLVRFGIARREAVFGALMLGLSPLFVPLAASYMTDVSGLLVILLCMYLCRRSLDAETEGRALLWLAAAALSNVAGGTVRQIAWLGALVMVPSTAWLLPRRARAMSVAAVLWLVSAAGIYGCLRWWRQQPYSVPESILQGAVTPIMVAHLLTELVKAVLCLCLLMLPLLTAWISRFPALTRKTQAAIALALLLLAAGAYLLHLRHMLHIWSMPWLFHVLGSENIFIGSWDMLGDRPVTIPVWLRVVVSLFVILSALTFAGHLSESGGRRQSGSPTAAKYGWRSLLVFFAPFIVAYVALMIPRGAYLFIYDRYLLGLMPVAILCLLKLHQEEMLGKLPALSYMVLVVFSIYGVLATHDLFAVNRARVAAVEKVHESGVPPSAIQAGFEYDGWTQITEVGYVNEPKIIIPRDAYHFNEKALQRPMRCRSGFDKYTPALDRQYFVVFSPMDCLLPSEFAPQAYTGWLPPFRRMLYIQRVPPLAMQGSGVN